MVLSARVSSYLSYAQRILLFIFGCLLFSLFTPVDASAQSYYPPAQQFANSHSSTNPDVPDNQHTKVQALSIEIMAAMICHLTGFDVITPEKGCLGIDTTTNKIGYVPQDEVKLGGLLGGMSTMIATLYQPPVSSTEYVKYMASNFGVVKSAHAQEAPADGTGTGFNSLSPIRDLWVKARNIAYLFFVLIFVILGIGIMLRVKIDPRTVMTIQNQIPRIIIALILVTFSYAIVGLLVDVMWISTYAAINVISPNELCGSQTQSLARAATGNLLDNPIAYAINIFGDDTGCMGAFDGLSGMSVAVGNTLGDMLSRMVIESLGFNAEMGSCPKSWTSIFNGNLDNCIKEGFFGIMKYFIGILAALIILVALLIALFRVWFMLLRAFIYVVLGTITAPLYIAWGLMPGSSLGFGNWLRFVGAHLAIFPATVAMLVVARVIYSNQAFNNPDGNDFTFIPPLIGNPNVADNMGNLIAVGIIFITPEVINLLRDAFKTKPNPYLSPAISKGFGAGQAVVAGATGAFMARSLRLGTQQYNAGWLRNLAFEGSDSKNPGRFMRAKNSLAKNILGVKEIKYHTPDGPRSLKEPEGPGGHS